MGTTRIIPLRLSTEEHALLHQATRVAGELSVANYIRGRLGLPKRKPRERTDLQRPATAAK